MDIIRIKLLCELRYGHLAGMHAQDEQGTPAEHCLVRSPWQYCLRRTGSWLPDCRRDLQVRRRVQSDSRRPLLQHAVIAGIYFLR